MKALKLSTFVLLLVSVFSSCTREDIPATKAPGAVNATPNSKAVATIVNFSIAPNPAYLSQDVTVSGILHFDKAVNKFTATVEKSTTGTPNPDGTTTWTNFQPTTYALDTTLPTTQWVTDMPFSFTFPASELGVSKTGWRLQVSGRDVKSGAIGNATLEIIPDPVNECLPLALKGELTSHKLISGNLYEFEVTYTVSSCPAMGSAKLQGGLTAVSSFDESGMSTTDKAETTIGQERKNTNNDNHIIQWDFVIGQKYSNTFTVKFTKELKGEAPYQLTGQWSVSAVNPGTGLEEKPTADPITFKP